MAASSTAPAKRRSLTDLQNEYDSGTTAPLQTLMRAWKGIKELPADDPNSFFVIGGYHGEPFRGKGELDPSWWGGYCQHGSVLFPSWHRAYLSRLEKALQSIPGCGDVMLPFWDECSEESRAKGIPKALTDETFVLDGRTIRNPLRSFVLPVAIVDEVKGDPVRYSKPAGYETVRYPLSGLVGTPEDLAKTQSHNAEFADHAETVRYLNDNIVTWLRGKISIDGKWLGEVFSSFVRSLDAPNYTLFSNTTSASAWNKAHRTKLVSLESPHNAIHLAVGGFDYPGQGHFSLDRGANGDMGENDTAGLDPIFFFHHCFIDYAFWIWQRRHSATDALTIDASDPGTKYSSAAPPPAGGDPDAPLSLDTPLDPFRKPGGSEPFTTRDCVNIETQLGYSYDKGSLDPYAQPPAKAHMEAAAATTPAGHSLEVSGINRAQIRGSFLISAFAMLDGERRHIGTEAVLSRWHVEGCMNCRNHLEATASFRLPAAAKRAAAAASGVEVEVRTHQGLLGGKPRGPGLEARAAEAAREAVPFRVEIR